MSILSHCLPEPLLTTAKNIREGWRIARRHRRAWHHLQKTAVNLSVRCLDSVNTLEEWERQRPLLREKFSRMLGLDPPPSRLGPVPFHTVGSLNRPAYTIDKIVFEPLPGLLITANYYRPKAASSSALPCILYLCGHMPHPLGAKTQYQDRYLWYPMNGFACLAVDPLQFGEVPGVHHGTHDLNRWDWISLGYTPAGVEVWTAMRAIDWLSLRPEIDSQKIGVTGISGGGVMTWFLAALDERVAAAAPSCSTYTIGSQVAGGLVGQQCDCVFYPNVFQIDFPAIAALVAPRPLLILNGRKDPIFPPSGFRPAVRRVEQIYRLYASAPEAQARCRAVESNGGHEDPPLFLRETRRWMAQWLKTDPLDTLSMETTPTPEPPEQLACLDGPPIKAANYHIHHEFIRPPAVAMDTTGERWATQRAQILDYLKNMVFGWFPAEPIPFRSRQLSNKGGYAPRFCAFSEHEFDSEPGVPVRVLLFRPRSPVLRCPLLLTIRRAGDLVSFPDLDEFLPLLSKVCVMILFPRYSEKTLSPSAFAVLERASGLLGRSIASQQVWDALRALQWAKAAAGLSPSSVHIHGRGGAAVVALYAGLLEERIDQVIMEAPPGSHRQGPALPAILRMADIPVSAACLGPQRLALLEPACHSRTESHPSSLCFAGAERFPRARSLCEAVWMHVGSPVAQVLPRPESPQ